ncbi:unnamed protein product [Durusdinium trenchii]|uniref:S1 motif domain-containing protein n=1 Tax=Durusdinium trenchii TaxID=1381693 RepID=A0ABP0L2X3_9DINO
MEAFHDYDWRECEVIEVSGGRSKVRFLDGEEREVTQVREPAVPLYMLYVGQGCEGIVTRINPDGEAFVDIGAETCGQIPGRLLGSGAFMRKTIDLGQMIDVWISGVDAGKQRLLLTPWKGCAHLAEEVSSRQQRFRNYILQREPQSLRTAPQTKKKGYESKKV